MFPAQGNFDTRRNSEYSPLRAKFAFTFAGSRVCKNGVKGLFTFYFLLLGANYFVLCPLIRNFVVENKRK